VLVVTRVTDRAPCQEAFVPRVRPGPVSKIEVRTCREAAHPPMQQRVLSYEPVPCRGLTRLRMATSEDLADVTVPCVAGF
jgi:hypothetical protein